MLVAWLKKAVDVEQEVLTSLVNNIGKIVIILMNYYIILIELI
jgi:hypothetical protein